MSDTRREAGGGGEHEIVHRRCLNKSAAAEYLAVSEDTIDRLINTGQLPIVKLPVQNTKHGPDRCGTSRRISIDRHDLDELIDRNKEVRGAGGTRPVIVARRG